MVPYLVVLFVTVLHEWSPELQSAGFGLLRGRNKSSSLLQLISVVSRSRLFTRVGAASLAVLLATTLMQFFTDCFAAGGLPQVAAVAILLGLIPPALSMLGLALCQVYRFGTGASDSGNGFNLANRVRTLLMIRMPYLAAYSGFVVLVLSICFLPAGLGDAIAGWLESTLADARVAASTTARGIQFTLMISTIVAVALFNAGSGLATKLSAAFQVFVNRCIINGDSILDALIETTNIRSTAVLLPESTSNVNNILSILAWLTFCYAALFSLVAFCPPPLGDTITNWLWACLRDASMELNPHKHANLKLFLASVVAAYGAVPVAVMSCVFLTRRKQPVLIVSSQGILCPNSLANMFGLSPLKLWRDLRTVNLRSTGADRTLALKYKWGDTIKLKIDRINPTQLHELLTAIDEYAARCKFDTPTMELRSRLLQQTKTSAVIEADKFASTIFSARRNGDRLCAGKYRVVRKLAGKSLTTVYLARDSNDEHVVIKEFVLPTASRSSEKMVETFEREFSILSVLNHKSIARVKDRFEEDAARYLVMEHVSGSDLRTLVERRGHRDERNVVRWAIEIAQVVNFLHKQDPPVLHRDLTPDNLMEDEEGQIKLIDFGAAHQFMEGVTGTLIGKQCYIAPEQLRGAPSVRSDIYSFGCTLSFLLTGNDPTALKQCELVDAPQASAAMVQLVKRCTEFEESSRYQSFDEVLVDLMQLSEGNKVKIKRGASAT